MYVHHVQSLPSDSIFVAGIATTSPSRTLLDLASVVSPDALQLAVEDALRRGLTSLARLRWCLSTQGGHGRPGTATLRRIVCDYETLKRPTDSGFEARLHQVLSRGGLPVPERQHEIRHRGKVVARVDFAYPRSKLAIEAVSFRWHSGRSAWARDQNRGNAVAALGWRTIAVTWDDLRNEPDSVIRRIKQALGYGELWD
jgi:very-short-patch-repair endonuclease